ncbi:hypothetical protein SDC9_161197 [bioreactor metagenome]|uniref:Uncharacterized protein n=1 Tax=bioreactor metagenome TaxID=1076179 RepID=A0A645FHL0_9ZZZZ
MLGSVLNRTVSGSFPALDFMITAPEVRSPYSTEGIPRITSMDSMLSVEIVLISKPELGDEPPAAAPPPPLIVGERV